MNLKFGDKVIVTKSGFYNGAKGIIVYQDALDLKYEVQLSFNITKNFYKSDLKKIRKSKNEK